MIANIVKWGNSQGVIIPKVFMEECSFKTGDKVSMESRNGEIVIRHVVRHRTLEERAAEYGGRLGDFMEIDWGQPTGREIW